jgi:hypothetical protein
MTIKEFFATELSTIYEGNLNLDYSILMLQVLWFYLRAQASYFKKEMIDFVLVYLIPKNGAYGQTVTFYFTAIYFICTAIMLYRHRETETQTRLFI